MTTRLIKTVTLIACAVFSTLALAADPPARVGRVALAQGQVSISGDAGEQASDALVNWPVTSHNLLTTGPGARTEIRIGSTSLRLDADSSLEVEELDDDSLRLRLNYGSANLRVANADALRGFELSTPNAQVRLQEPGRLRIDAGRRRGTTTVNVFEGVALVEDRGAQLIVRAGKRADIGEDDVRTGVASRDGFDDWAAQRDRIYDSSVSARYVTSEMTGYEELDQNGVWRDDAEYGPLWLPRTVGADWAPYRDGNWTWIAPWGWTWVDNAPWGYAPFHYGRWVHVNNRWAWAPGRHVGRPVWAPALVGWVGGNGWSASFGGRGQRPAQGWYPLAPHDAFVPGYRLSHDHLQRINRDARQDRHDGRERDGLTVVAHDHFDRRGTIAVRNVPKAAVPLGALRNAPGTAPAVPQDWRERAGRDRDGRGARDARDARDGGERDASQRDRRPEAAQRPPAAGQPQPPVMSAPAGAQPPFGNRYGRDGDERRQRQPSGPVGSAIATAAAAAAAAAPQPQPQQQQQIVAPAPQPVAVPAEQRARGNRNDGERRLREADAPGQPRPASPAFHQQMAPAPVPLVATPGQPGAAPQVFHQQSVPSPAAAPAPVFHHHTAPPPAAAPAAAPAPARQAPPPQAAPAPQPAASAPPPERRGNSVGTDRRRGNDPDR